MPDEKYYFDGFRRDERRPTNRRVFAVGQMWDIHHEIARRVALGERNKDIAKALHVSEVMVSYTKNSKIVSDQIEILRGAMDADTVDLGIRIRKFAPVALQLLEDVVSGEGAGKDASIGLRARYADRHLDRAGYSPVKKIATMSGHLTPEQIDGIKERALSSGMVPDKESEDVIDITENKDQGDNGGSPEAQLSR